MESSHLIGDTEECNSCESGWTMYIGSPMHDNDADDDSGDNYDRGIVDVDGGGGADDDSDDSMASDASSGPSHRDHFYDIINEMDVSENEDKNEDDENEDRDDGNEGGGECSGYSYKRSYKRKEKIKGGRIEVKKENPFHMEGKTNLVSSSSKVRKTRSMRKGN